MDCMVLAVPVELMVSSGLGCRGTGWPSQDLLVPMRRVEEGGDAGDKIMMKSRATGHGK